MPEDVCRCYICAQQVRHVEARSVLWRMQDYGELIQKHRESHADITMATHAVGLGQASFRGCCKVDSDSRKPHIASVLLAVHLRLRLALCLHLGSRAVVERRQLHTAGGLFVSRRVGAPLILCVRHHQAIVTYCPWKYSLVPEVPVCVLTACVVAGQGCQASRRSHQEMLCMSGRVSLRMPPTKTPLRLPWASMSSRGKSW